MRRQAQRILLRLRERILRRIRVQALRAKDVRERAALPPRARRRFGVRPLFRRRHIHGAFTTLLPDLREDGEKFYNYFRMTPEMLDHLLEITRERLQLRARNSISPEEQLCVTLRYLAAWNSMADLQYSYRRSPAAIIQIIWRVCRAIWEELGREVFEQPSEEMWARVAQDFEATSHFPNCCGAMDGRHNVIVAIPNYGSANYNFKNQHSVVLLADAAYKFIMVDVGARGGRHDGGILKSSAFGRQLMSGRLNLPEARIPPNFEKPLPHCFIGTNAFPLRPDFMIPHKGDNLPQGDNVFNYRLSRARRIVENAFGILSAMWRILRRPIQASPETVNAITMACCALHNYHCMANRDRYIPPGMADENNDGEKVPGRWRQHAGAIRLVEGQQHAPHENTASLFTEGERVRQDFTEHFIENPDPWQWKKFPPPEESDDEEDC